MDMRKKVQKMHIKENLILGTNEPGIRQHLNYPFLLVNANANLLSLV